MESVMQAAILIGGKGTRLGDAVRATPKPLLEVCKRPFVEHVMLNLRRFGFNDFVLLAGYQSEVVLEIYGPGCDFSEELQANISVIVEPAPLGTAGALKFARDYMQDEFLLVNGDSVFDFNYLDLSNCAREGEPLDWLGRVALLSVDDVSRYGLVELSGTCISAFKEKSPTPQPGTVNSGVYWLKAKIFELIDDSPCSLEEDVFPKLISTGSLIGRTYTGFFIDIGIPEDLERARESLLSDLRKPAAFLDRDGTLNLDSGYTHKIDDFRWINGAMKAIRQLNDAGYLVFIVTNQAGIARGYYEYSDVDLLHQWMQQDLARIGAHIDDFRYCPHYPDGVVPALSIDCKCRKPGTAMLEGLIQHWQPDTTNSFMLGDSTNDVQAGNNAGIKSEKVATGAIAKAITKIIQQAKSDQIVS